MATATTKAKPTDRIKMRIRKGDTVQVIAARTRAKPVRYCAPSRTRTE